ncbi:hypothetical protein DDB_G0292864 [Dictyostelium discoideum AX4]|uniref:hypothetical protein n=1 Tax=Dictyostelium discoideum AX4 TaxID=352472 RepID=UPI00004E4FD8|nr:hypothetical protein DDB_G0292864 [Dictyostelium discoideum AX4]EAL60981.1 hypothetical protein DDB_G0292864 [Dictyostelium discoideum AX4]|eukprot:XP_629397.1 hypothetical protein DDB_G0292864 [Dictyostelium discoideum AX4]
MDWSMETMKQHNELYRGSKSSNITGSYGRGIGTIHQKLPDQIGVFRTTPNSKRVFKT